MEHSVVEREACSVCGLGLDCPQDDISGIDPLWAECMARRAELPDDVAHGISREHPGGFYYVAGVAADPTTTAAPEGMEWIKVPAGRYVRVEFEGTPQQMSAAFDSIFDELLPAHGLSTPAGGFTVETYADQCDPSGAALRAELYVQVV